MVGVGVGASYSIGDKWRGLAQLHRIVLVCIVLYRVVLYYIALCCIVLPCIIVSSLLEVLFLLLSSFVVVVVVVVAICMFGRAVVQEVLAEPVRRSGVPAQLSYKQ